MPRRLNVLTLLTDGFGGVGGIAKFNTDFVTAMGSSTEVEHIYALPRLIQGPIDQPIPASTTYDHRAGRGKVAFIERVLFHSIGGASIDLVICGHLNLLPAAWLAARLQRARLALVVHGFEAWAPARNPLVNWLANTPGSIVAVSEYSARRFNSWAHADGAEPFIMPNCVDLARFRPLPRDSGLVERYGLTGAKVLLTIGRMAAHERFKGHDEVLDLMPRLIREVPDVKYLIVGDGTDRPRLEAKTAALGLSNRVIFAGIIPESEKVAHYNLADAYVMPSRAEGFGIVLIEAAACGVPVVGSTLDGSRSALLDGRLGQLVDPRDSNGLLAAIASALTDSAQHRRNELVETFSVPNFTSRVHDWLNRQASALPQRRR